MFEQSKQNARVKRKVRGNYAKKIVSARHEARGSEVTEGCKCESRGSEAPDKPAGLVWNTAKMRIGCIWIMKNHDKKNNTDF